MDLEILSQEKVPPELHSRAKLCTQASEDQAGQAPLERHADTAAEKSTVHSSNRAGTGRGTPCPHCSLGPLPSWA